MRGQMRAPGSATPPRPTVAPPSPPAAGGRPFEVTFRTGVTDGPPSVELLIDGHTVIMPVPNGWRCALCGLPVPGPLRKCTCGAMVATSGEVLR